MGCGGSDNGDELREQERARVARIETGKKSIDAAFEGFDDEFYNQRVKEYEDFAVPQLNTQYDRTKKNLMYSLARSGLLNSSTEVEKGGALDTELAQKYRDVVDTGKGQANALRRDVEGQRNNLVAQLQASGDPGSAANLALRTAQAYEQPTSFAPIGNFFEGWTRNYLANETARQYNPNQQQQPMFGWGGTAQRVVQ
jgi:hypothetical protein